MKNELETQNWKIRYYMIFIGQALSQIGSAVTQFILMWWIASTIGEVSAMATAGIFALLPQAILGPVGGVLADRYSRRLIMIISDSITALCMVVLIILFSSGTVELWHVYTLLFIRSSMQAFQGPASQSSTVMLVPPHFLSKAAGLNQSIISLMTIAAAPVGALAMGAFSFQGALMIDVVTACLGVFPLLIFKIPQPAVAENSLGPIKEFSEGLSFIWKNKTLKMLYAIQGIVILIIMPSFTLVPLLITEHFKGGVNDVAVMEGLAGAAMLLGSILSAFIETKRKVLVFLINLAICSFMVSLTALMTKETFALAVTFWAISGIVYTFGSTPITALLQKTIPPHLQGRAFSLLTTVIAFASPIGLSLYGPIGKVIGIQGLYIWAGILAGVVCLLCLYSKELFALEKKDYKPVY